MNIQKVFLGLTFAVAVVALFLPFAPIPPTGGVSNFDSLQLQSEVAGDDALDVRDTSGVSKLVVSGSGAITASGAFTATGESRIEHLRETGTVLTPATSSVITLTAAQFCDNPIIVLGDWTPAASSTAILNLPVAEDVFSNCLTTDGDSFSFILYNDASASASSTLITAGSASTTIYGFDTSEEVILGGSVALVEIWRKSSTAMEVGVHNFVVAD